MLKMIKGVSINDYDKLDEGFEITNKKIIANINEDKILEVLMDYIDMESAPLCLIIEVPTNVVDEESNNNIIEDFHKDVYYADGLSSDTIKDVLNNFGDLFINDGLSCIGVLSHVTKSEIMKDKYNVVYVYTGDESCDKYTKIFTKNNLNEVNKLITAWDYFSEENPGMCVSIRENGKTVYDVVNILKDSIGLYFAERRKD